MAIFILVHGTFAQNASWTKADSPLCNRLQRAALTHGHSAKFVPVEWSGKNLGRDRVATAESIAGVIETGRAENPDEHIFLVGHSHGGSAIAYLLKNFRDVREQVAGCAFLSTPFVAQRLRPLWSELLTAITAVAGMLMFFLVAVIAAYLIAKAGWIDRPDAKLPAILSVAAFFIAGATAAAWIWVKLAPGIRSSLHDSILRRIAESETADIPSGPHLFLRASGDEAAAALSADQFIAWSAGKLVGFSSTVVLLLRLMLMKIYHRYPGRIVLILAWVLFAIWLNALFLISFALSSPFEQFVRDVFVKSWHMGETDFGVYGTVIDWSATILWPVFVVLFVGSLAYAIILMLGLIIGALAFRLFGWMNYREAIFTDFSVEPVPYGQVNFIHIDWKDQGLDISGLSHLSHSRTYLNPHALDCLADWVSKKLEAAPAALVKSAERRP
jgi:pimeloyl-ACP methyl ester carboxylesterase